MCDLLAAVLKNILIFVLAPPCLGGLGGVTALSLPLGSCFGANPSPDLSVNYYFMFILAPSTARYWSRSGRLYDPMRRRTVQVGALNVTCRD